MLPLILHAPASVLHDNQRPWSHLHRVTEQGREAFMKILLMPGLTLPEITADDVARVRAAAGSDAEVIVTTPAEASKHAGDA